MGDSVQQPAAGSLFAHRPNLEPVGLQRSAYPFKIGRGLHVEVCRETDTVFGTAKTVSSGRPPAGPHLVQHSVRGRAQPVVGHGNREGVASLCTFEYQSKTQWVG